MAQSLKEWLGAFVTAELEAVIAWNASSKETSAVKKEPNERFTDDGSNFRSSVGSPPLTADCRVQILSVISSASPAVLLLSDGSCSIRATLSDEARTTLEAEIEEKLNVDTTGDVFSFNEVILSSTPYGLSEGLVQLSIDDLQYHYHLRKKLNKARPIEESPQVSRLIDEIKRIRTAQYDVEEEGEDVAMSQESPRTNVHFQRAETQVIRTQVPARKKRAGPSLAKEGFEVEEGVNLARPAAPGRENIASKPNATVPSNKSAALLNLLGGRRTTIVEPAPAQQTTTKTPSSGPALPSSGSAIQSLGSVLKLPSQHATPPRNIRVAYSRRRIPENQQRLLDRKDSWFPPLPGHQTPTPNVPVELLTKWNAQASPSKSSEPQPATQSGAQQPASASKAISIASSEESSDVSSEDEIAPSQWPDSPPVKRNMLPPDSTVGSRPSGQSLVSPQKQDMLPPDSTVGSRPSGTSLVSPQKRDVLPSDSTIGSRLSGQSLVSPQKRAILPPDSTIGSRQSGLSPISPQKPSVLPPDSTIGNRQSGQSPISPQKLPLRSPAKPHAAQKVNSTPPRPPSTNTPQYPMQTPKHMLPPKVPARSSGVHTIIKGTQYSADNDEMEMEVPRPLQDPTMLHQRRRSEHMRGAQRQNWLRANYEYKTEPGPFRAQVHEHYTATYPNDPVTRTEMLAAVRDVFPLFDVRPIEGLMRKDQSVEIHDDLERKEESVKTAVPSGPKSVAGLPLLARRVAWFKANCVYRFEPGPTRPELMKAFATYHATNSDDQCPVEELCESVSAAFPQLSVKPQNGVKMRESVSTPTKPELDKPARKAAKPQGRSDADLSARRKAWFKANCAYGNPSSSFRQDLTAVYKAYRDAHPDEDPSVMSPTKLFQDIRLAFSKLNHLPVTLRSAIASTKLKQAESRRSALQPRLVGRKEHRDWLEANCQYRHDASPQVKDMAEVFAKFHATWPNEIKAEEFSSLVKQVLPRYRDKPENGIKLRPPSTATARRPSHGTTEEVRKAHCSGSKKEADDEVPDGQHNVHAPRPTSANAAAPTIPGPEQSSPIRSEPPAASGSEKLAASSSRLRTTAGPRPSSASLAEPTIIKPRPASIFEVRSPALKGGVAPVEKANPFTIYDDARSQDNVSITPAAPSNLSADSKPDALTNGTHAVKPTPRPMASGSIHEDKRLDIPQLDGSNTQLESQDTDVERSPLMTVFEDFFQAWKGLKPGGASAQPTSGRTRPAGRRVNLLASNWEV